MVYTPHKMSIKKSRKSKQGKNNFDINFRPIPSEVSNNQVLRGSTTVPKIIMPTTKLVGYTKKGAAIREPLNAQNHTTANHIASRTRKHRSGKMQSLKRRITMG